MEVDGLCITVEHASSLVTIFGLLFERNACIVAIIVVSFVDSYMIRQCFGFIKVLKVPTRRISWVIARCLSPNK